MHVEHSCAAKGVVLVWPKQIRMWRCSPVLSEAGEHLGVNIFVSADETVELYDTAVGTLLRREVVRNHGHGHQHVEQRDLWD